MQKCHSFVSEHRRISYIMPTVWKKDRTTQRRRILALLCGGWQLRVVLPARVWTRWFHTTTHHYLKLVLLQEIVVLLVAQCCYRKRLYYYLYQLIRQEAKSIVADFRTSLAKISVFDFSHSLKIIPYTKQTKEQFTCYLNSTLISCWID
jgi:hypothetical protein